MEFLHVDANNPASAVDSVRVNWYYRPRDVQRFSSDTRLVFGTMHSDMCPITSLRGKCTIKHRSEIEDLDAYRKERDSFFYVQVYDRFIRRSYECIPVQQIINVPDKVKKALNERWKFVVVETGRVKELTSAAKTCKRCARYCASNDSVDCAICKNSYHMNCVQPPLPKKPSRGFAWACGPCSRASMKEMEARNTPTLGGAEAEEEEIVEEEEQPEPSSDNTRAPSPNADDMAIDDHPATQAEIALAKMWPMRYLGIHARLEDALQYDDRAIYPRASSRLGPRHQANTPLWHGRPVELVKPAEIKKRYNKGATQKKEGKLTKETLAAIEADREERAKRPKWVQDEPPGYIPRGEDFPNDDPRCTAKLIFRMPTAQSEKPVDPEVRERDEQAVDEYVGRAKQLARGIGVPPFGINFLDKSLELLAANKYDPAPALEQLKKVDRQKDLHEPVITRSDLIKFEEGVAKYGSEHRLIRLHMKSSLPHADIVRFYYLWKKTPKGREIWGNYGGRKKRKIESDAGAKLQAELAHDVDDSAFDNDKAARKSRGFQCKFCNTTHSRQWRRAPGVSPGQLAPVDAKGVKQDKKDRPLLALCLRCAGLWRKYAIQWEDVDDVKKVAQGGGKGIKRRIDEELLRELVAANEAAQAAALEPAAHDSGEPAKKKAKHDKDAAPAAIEAPAAKKKEKLAPPPKEPTPPPPPIIPAQPTWRDLPCAVCKAVGDTVACQHCKLTVHRKCFGLRENEGIKSDGEVKWICEQCQNDRNPAVSTEYSCCLCLTEETLIDLVEPPRVSHKKKTDREREKERLEKELADAMRAEYRARQLAQNRPPGPREPLKPTTGNNWVHVYCAVWTPEIRFSNAKALQVAEGFPLIPPARFEAVCKLCKNKDHQNRVRSNAGACLNCFQCNAPFHASCAFEAGYQFGFDVQPVKGSRKDQVVTVTMGSETGYASPVVLCKEHVLKSILHPVNEVVDENGTTALQVYVENYKQADLTLTGTVRKAQLAQQTKEKGQLAGAGAGAAQNAAGRRESGVHSIAAAVKRGARTSSVADITKIEPEELSSTDLASIPGEPVDRRCAKCHIDVTPRWHQVAWSGAADGVPALRQHRSTASVEMVDADRDPRNIGSEPPQQVTPSQQSKQQNIRFVPIGASGRAWEGMPDRRGGSRASVNGDRGGSVEGTPATEQQSNGGHHLPFEELRREIEDGYHNHALPPIQNHGSAEARPGEGPLEWFCHKCFLKQKLVPTPPPEDHLDSRKKEEARSPPKPTEASIESQFRVWDEPPPPPPPPPARAPIAPPVNGMGPGPSYGPPYPQHPQPPPGYGHPQPPPLPPHYSPHSNGYHPSPPQPPIQHRHGIPPAHSMHDRHGSYGYQAPPPPPPPSNYGPHGPSPTPHPHSRPPPINSYPPLPNGLHGSHGPPPVQASASIRSPTYSTLPQQLPPPTSMRSDPGHAPHLSPIGPPSYSRQDSLYRQPRPNEPIVHPMPPPGSNAPLPPPPHIPSTTMPIDPSLLYSSPPQPPPPTSVPAAGPPPGTPRGAPTLPPPAPAQSSGASNSPSLANLLS